MSTKTMNVFDANKIHNNGRSHPDMNIQSSECLLFDLDHSTKANKTQSSKRETPVKQQQRPNSRTQETTPPSSSSSTRWATSLNSPPPANLPPPKFSLSPSSPTSNPPHSQSSPSSSSPPSPHLSSDSKIPHSNFAPKILNFEENEINSTTPPTGITEINPSTVHYPPHNNFYNVNVNNNTSENRAHVANGNNINHNNNNNNNNNNNHYGYIHQQQQMYYGPQIQMPYSSMEQFYYINARQERPGFMQYGSHFNNGGHGMNGNMQKDYMRNDLNQMSNDIKRLLNLNEQNSRNVPG
eukprot:TRINITY_DN169_c1_g2_i1.p1 TRINITY_DN169_c1_g2~~TRINITY_DN169_c1_g2_i1.p1  ORF type:complete len:306 (-),score=108.83 TRINITY_DN169_c1_g2_i1:151-1038(-)